VKDEGALAPVAHVDGHDASEKEVVVAAGVDLL
jgi:hypothetical protein